MNRKRIGLLILIIMIGSLSGVGFAKPMTQDLKVYLGEITDSLPKELIKLNQDGGISWIIDEEQRIQEITLKDDTYTMLGISIGDNISKISEIYGDNKIVRKNDYIWIGFGELNNYDVVTKEAKFILNEENNIKEIVYKFTAPFTQNPIPASNTEAKRLLEGEWVSIYDRTLIFKDGIIYDNILDDIWEQQSYSVIAPNKVLIKRRKENQAEGVMLNFWIDEKQLAIFLVDEHGVPIEKTIEIFNKK
ncbi:MAG: hypothetical protein ACRCSG_04945 [Cellulosilyticaceae bacterium]